MCVDANIHEQMQMPNTLDTLLPAAIDPDREDVIVEALFNHVDDLRICADFSALQTFPTKHGDGGNRECLPKERARLEWERNGQ